MASAATVNAVAAAATEPVRASPATWRTTLSRVEKSNVQMSAKTIPTSRTWGGARRLARKYDPRKHDQDGPEEKRRLRRLAERDDRDRYCEERSAADHDRRP
jgi:hypothetical protein